MYSEDKFIGPVLDKTGGYTSTVFEELSARNMATGGETDLYILRSRFGGTYYISEPHLVLSITRRISTIERLDQENVDSSSWFSDLVNFVYTLVAETFSVLEIVRTATDMMGQERSRGFKEGKRSNQKAMREVLGINE